MKHTSALCALSELAAVLEEVRGPVVLWLDAPGRVHGWRIGPTDCSEEPTGPPLTEEKYLSVEEVAAHLGISVRSVWRWLKAGSFPRPASWGKRLVRWPLSEVQSFARRCQEQPA